MVFEIPRLNGSMLRGLVSNVRFCGQTLRKEGLAIKKNRKAGIERVSTSTVVNKFQGQRRGTEGHEGS